jgi:hypothetical protein
MANSSFASDPAFMLSLHFAGADVHRQTDRLQMVSNPATARAESGIGTAWLSRAATGTD